MDLESSPWKITNPSTFIYYDDVPVSKEDDDYEDEDH